MYSEVCYTVSLSQRWQGITFRRAFLRTCDIGLNILAWPAQYIINFTFICYRHYPAISRVLAADWIICLTWDQCILFAILQGWRCDITESIIWKVLTWVCGKSWFTCAGAWLCQGSMWPTVRHAKIARDDLNICKFCKICFLAYIARVICKNTRIPCSNYSLMYDLTIFLLNLLLSEGQTLCQALAFKCLCLTKWSLFCEFKQTFAA